ncbi:DUF3025 domain-containing protein [Nitrosomonas sp.]|uniref:DUF3025 domain-containing protein n=1 Tax=Nitrosomonas sp. TaxID=42353 RepID=UPI0026168B11|nr:DUF3025 domain-containing protein [Nitrosomonas sp.]
MDLSPIFGSFRHLKEYVAAMQYWPELSDLNNLSIQQKQRIVTQSGKDVCFVPIIRGKQCIEQNYEAKIYLTGQVQTRAKNWHDFFNALVWQIFPRAKSALNQLHYQAQLFESVNKIKQRGVLRDAATLFDESGVIVVSSQKALIQLLRNFEWKQLFWQQREAVLSSMRFFVFGHGLYEKGLNPYTGMTGKGIAFNVDETFFDQTILEQFQSIDLMLAFYLLESLSSNADLTPIPLLGYPGWVEDNSKEAYYENKKYFRDRYKLADSIS